MLFNYISMQVTDKNDYLIKLTGSKKGLAIHYENLDWHRQIELKDIVDVWQFKDEESKEVYIGKGKSDFISKKCNSICFKLKSGETLRFKPFFSFSRKHFNIKKWYEVLGFYETTERKKS